MEPPDTKTIKPPIGRRKGPWSQAELEKLKRKFGRTPDGVLARELNRSVESVRRMARRHFSGEPRCGPWNPDEILMLKEYWGAAEIEVISMILRRTPNDIALKVQEIRGDIARRVWTTEDLQALKRHYGTRTAADLVVILGRHAEEIESKAREFRLAKDKGFQRRHGNGKRVRMPRWTTADVEKLCKLYPETANLDIARALDRTLKSVVSKAHDLGLRKSPDRLKEMGRENVRIRYEKRDQSENGSSTADGRVDG